MMERREPLVVLYDAENTVNTANYAASTSADRAPMARPSYMKSAKVADKSEAYRKLRQYR